MAGSPPEETIDAQILAELREINARLGRAESALGQARPIVSGYLRKLLGNPRIQKMLK